ncbi:hypothetical protein ESOMN_v1c05990 [Williamsoniiplasma somnilux]|uniref:Uncharacterized protein n=1 Tax=Williamsoniiplasma somnilux TaxID=215578 RepID=A0A2K8P1U8_9MOLU|nr:ATP-binding protein [Williamsoniiplasma somnilux]ATZ18981.1 hypothetical protein ESOMN_v1c05990 [Williamsoniiplasma somnilux]
MKKQMQTPYASLLAKKNDPSKPYYMISELIDNSIASWDDNKMKQSLKIEILIDNVNKKIELVDNAFGMSEDELANSIKLNLETPGNKLNMFGVGMKNCAFWFGKDLTIISKKNNSKIAYKTEILISKISDINDVVTWEVEKYKGDITGTKIIIENIYAERIIQKSVLEKDIIPILKSKYCKYISEKGVGIDIKFVDARSNQKFSYEIDSEAYISQVISEKFKIKFLENVENYIKKPKILKGLKAKVIEKVENNDPLDFEFVIQRFDNDIHFRFGILSQGSVGQDEVKQFKKMYGLTTFQNGRAININNVNAIELGEYTRTNIKRVYGQVELGHIFRPDNNKQAFNFGENEEDFKELIKDIGSDLLELANCVKVTIGNEMRIKNGNTKSTANKIEKTLNHKTNLNFAINNNEIVFIDNIKNFKIEIEEVTESDKNAPYYFVRAENKEFEPVRHIKITFNINHPIWKPLTLGNKIDLKEVLYPLISVIGISNLIFDDKLLQYIIGSKTTGKADLEDVLNKIARYLIK